MVRDVPPPTTDEATPEHEPSGEVPPEGTIELWVSDQPKARRWRFEGDQLSIGSHPSNELVLKDPAVSRFHCELRRDGDLVLARDLGSRNGTFIDGVRVKEAYVRQGSTLLLGRVPIRLGAAAAARARAVSDASSFAGLVGESMAMRSAFAVLERAAGSQSTVLLEGETGTGKGEAALGIHDGGARKGKPFVVVDCGAVPKELFESELFGHERGAFTGADGQRIGAFETANGGTIFLDEVGELPLDVQPKLLRALEERQIRRLGSSQVRTVDVRVIAATNRDLRGAVNEGGFRADLYYRLAVVRVRLPPLRERQDDLPLIAEKLLRSLGVTEPQTRALLSPESVAALRLNPWRGNVRELRNHLEQAVVLEEHPAQTDTAWSKDGPEALAFQEARSRVLADFERQYLERLMAKHEGKVVAAAEEAGLSRVYLYRLLAKYRLLR